MNYSIKSAVWKDEKIVEETPGFLWALSFFLCSVREKTILFLFYFAKNLVFLILI